MKPFNTDARREVVSASHELRLRLDAIERQIAPLPAPPRFWFATVCFDASGNGDMIYAANVAPDQMMAMLRHFLTGNDHPQKGPLQ